MDSESLNDTLPDFLTGETPELSELRTEMHLAGISSAAAAFISAKMFLSSQSLILELGLFLAVFAPLLYATEIAMDDLRERTV
jgi:hypothetical protein